MKKKFLKLKDFMNLVQNKTTKQYSYNLKKKQLQYLGITPKGVLNLKIPISDLKKKERRPVKWR